MKKIFNFLLVFICIFLLTSCLKQNEQPNLNEGTNVSTSTKDDTVISDDTVIKKDPAITIDPFYREYGEDGIAAIFDGGITSFGGGITSSGKLNGQSSATYGTLTGSVLFDNEDYEFWQSLISQNQEENGKFQKYHETFGFEDDLRIHVKIEGAKNAKVEILNDGFTTMTDYLGNAYLYPSKLMRSYDLKVTYLSETNEIKTQEFKIEGDATLKLNETSKREEKLQIMFVIDTTGSMGDELTYLQKEIEDVISDVQKQNPNTLITLSLIFYRDYKDEYVTREFAFTKNIAYQKENLMKQFSIGGGDFEEAVEVAFEKANEASWDTSSTTKLLFHVADAPSHDKDVFSWKESVLELGKKGVKIISVASSGINKKTEYFYRAQSLMTGGAYVYLTDDSGIGNPHLEAETKDKPTVEYLNALLKRIISGYHTGDFKEAIPYPYNDVIKKGQMPQEMPEDFSFCVHSFYEFGGKDFCKKYDLATSIYQVNNEQKEIVLTTDTKKEIYNILNMMDIDNVSTIDKDNHQEDIYLKITYGDVVKEIYYTYSLDNEEVDRFFEAMINKVFTKINDEIELKVEGS